MAESRRRDWRDPETRSEPSSAKPWQASGDTADDAPGLPSKRSVKRFLAIVALLSIAVVIGVIILLLRPIRPACLILVGSGYEHNLLLPHNIHGWNGGLRLLKDKDISEPTDLGDQVRSFFSVFFDPPSKMRRVDTPFELNDADWPSTWDRIVKEIDKGGEKENVLLYLSAHGYADDKDAYLLRNVLDVQSPDGFAQSRVPFRDVLDSLKKVKEPKKVVLLLDVCQVQSHWPIGMYRNDFAKQLEAIYAKDIAAAGNVTVICSTAPGQQSWASEEMQTSMFAHFVAQALKGEGRTTNDRVNAGDLHEQLKKHVNEWAKINRARAQTPILLSAASLPGTVELVRVTSHEQEKATSPKYNPGDLKKDWEAWRDLKTTAAPQVYSPHYWRLYQETLLRYEQLMRAGDPTDQAAKLKTNLGELAVLIRKARTLDGALDCVGNSFPMPRVLGFRPKEELAESVLRNYLARQKDEDLKARTESRKPFADKTQFEKQYWQARLSRLVLSDQLAKEKFNGERAREQLGQIAKDMDIAVQLSPEVHLVRMLNDVDPAMDKDVKTLALAVSVRMLAEEVALSMPDKNAPGELYAEVIFQRIKEGIEKADATRRKGEDLLFGEPSLHAGKALQELTDAKNQYESVRLKAQQVREALALRDELAADLPFLASWLAQTPAVDHPTKSETEIKSLRDRTEKLGIQLAELTAKLDRLDTELQEITKLAKPMRDTFNSVRDTSHQISGELARLKGGLQKNWHALAATLSVPPALAGDDAAALRVQLLESLKKTAEDIAAIKDPKGHIEEEEDTVSLQRKFVHSLLRSYEKQTQGPERNVDERVREFYLLQPRDIVREAGEKEDVQVLQTAAQRCRYLPAAMAEHVKDKKGTRLNPVDGLRRLRTYHLLDWLAQRTLDDHWFDAEANNASFYRPAAKAYLDAAASMLDAKSALRKPNEDKKAALADTGLVVSEVFNKYWTTELIFPVKWPVKADKGVPEGTPMTWLEIKKGSKKGAAWQLKEREPINPWISNDAAASFQLQSDSFVDAADATVVFHALYRGQHLRKEATIERPPPDIIVRHTLGPQKSGFAVRMEKALDYGAISIVIDTSGSMKYVHPWKNEKDTERIKLEPGERSRYEYALDAMKGVLEKIPNGTRISMITFVSNDKTTYPEFLEKPQAWQRGATDDVITKLRRHSLENSSPIANAIEKAMYEGFPGVTGGRKLVLVLTDGFDNISAVRGNLERNTEGVITKLRQANRNKPDIDVMIVGFLDPGDKRPVLGNKSEFDVAKDQFDYVKNFTDKSGFFPQAKGAELGRTIEELILRPYVQVKQNDKVVPGFVYGRPVNYHADNTLDWKPALDPGTYSASIIAGPNSGVDLKMPTGHNLFAVLKRRENRTFYMERGILGHQKEVVDGKYPVEAKDGWLATMLENHKFLATNKIGQLITLEKLQLENNIRQTLPGFTWLELAPVKGNRHEQTLEIENDWSLPTAAYTAKMRWPDDRPSRLTTWFWPEERDRFLLNDAVLSRRKMKVPFEADNNTEVIESITWERALDRLVVRVRFPVEKPVAVALKDYSDIATEHRYFLKAGRGTAYFYGLSALTIKEINVALVNIDAFKKEASRVEFTPDRDLDGPSIFYRRAE